MKHLEANIQRGVVTWLRYLENQGLLWFTHVGHGGGGRVRGAILAGLGLKPGVADLMILLPGGRVGFLELKTEKGDYLPLDGYGLASYSVSGVDLPQAAYGGTPWPINQRGLR